MPVCTLGTLTMHIALLRAVNLGPHNKVGMADLRRLVSGLGFGGVQSLLHTGNLVFDPGRARPRGVERALEASLAREFGIVTSVFVRTAQEWQAMMAANPFAAEAGETPSRVVAVCLKTPPKPGGVEALRDAIQGPERVEVIGTHAYLHYPDGIGNSRLTPDRIEKKLGTPGTARNWNTVARLAALARAG